MNDDQLDALLRDAGGRARAGAPDPARTEAALRALTSSPSDVIPVRRRTRWWVLPAALVTAAAAALIGVVVVNRPDESVRGVPAVTPPPASTEPRPVETTLSTNGPAVVIPTSAVPAPAPPTAPSSAPSAPASTATAGTGAVADATTTVATTSTTPAPDDLRTARVSVANYDGAGGACVEIVHDGGVEAAGCLPGPAVAAGRGAYFAGPAANAVVSVEPGGTTASYVEVSTPCFESIAVVGDPLKDVAGCTSRGEVLYARLSADPAVPTAYTTTFLDGGALHEVTTGVNGVAAFVAPPPTDGGVGCVVVVAAGAPGWRDACASPGQSMIAGSPETPLVVSVTGGDVSVTVVDADRRPLRNGCRATIGVLLAGLPTNAAMTGVRCVDGAAVGRFGAVQWQASPMPDGGFTLQRDAGDGTWPAGDTDTSLTCARYAQTCAAFHTTATLDEGVLEIPPLDLLLDDIGGENVLDPIDITSRYTADGPYGDTDALVAAVIAALQGTGGDGPDVEVTRATGADLLDVAVARIPDDSASDATQTIWFRPVDGGVQVVAAYESIHCSRGVTTLDGDQKVCV